MSSKCDEIQSLISATEKEKINIELKSFRKIKEKEFKKDIAYEIIAFANRNGGKLVLGINDDGSFDGKFFDNIDDFKGTISNICYDSISPVIDCNVELIECDENDIIVIYVPKRRSIPHAFVSEKNGHQIKKRIYYIRTDYGKKLVSDSQLEWLFTHQEDPEYIHKFRLAFEFTKDIEYYGIGGEIPFAYCGINNYLNRLTDEDKKFILEDNKIGRFILELTPFLILKTIQDYYFNSWYIGIQDDFGRISSGAKRKIVPSKRVLIPSIVTEGEQIVNNLSWDIKQILNDEHSKGFNYQFNIPDNTDIKIVYEKNKSEIVLKNPKFEISIMLGLLSHGAGLNPQTPNYEILYGRYSVADAQKYSWENFLHVDIGCYLSAQFDFPEYDIEEFKQHEHYFATLKEVINNNWNYDIMRAKLPSKEMLIMDSKINDILGLLQKVTDLNTVG